MSDSQPSLARRVLRRYFASDAGHWATIVAWNALFAFIPIVLVMATLLTVLLGSGEFESYLARELAPILRKTPAELIAELNGFRDKAGLLLVFSVITLLWSGAAFFGAIDNALSRISGGKPRSFLRQKRMGMGMIFVFVILVVPIVLSSALLSVHPTHLPAHLLPRFATTTSAGSRWGVYATQFTLSVVFGTILFAVIYRVVPTRRLPLRQVIPGAIGAGLLFESANMLFPLYFRTTEAGNAAAALLALPFLLTYFFTLGQIIVVGELVNIELSARSSTTPQAQRLSPAV